MKQIASFTIYVIELISHQHNESIFNANINMFKESVSPLHKPLVECKSWMRNL